MFSCLYYKVVAITGEKYANTGVHTITVESKKLFWVKMIDVQKRLGLKNIRIWLKKKYVLYLKQKTLQKNKRKNI